MSEREAHKLTVRYYRWYQPEGVRYSEDELMLSPKNTALLLVDVYGLGFDPQSDMGATPDFSRRRLAKKREIITRILSVKDAARKAGMNIIYATNSLQPATDENTEFRNLALRTCDVDILESWREPSPTLNFSKVIAPEPDAGDREIKKQFYSAFFGTDLDAILQSVGIKNLVVAGFETGTCVRETAVEAMYRDYKVIVLRDCCWTNEYPETEDETTMNNLAIRFIESNVGFTATSDTFIQICERIGEGKIKVEGDADDLYLAI